MSKVIYFVQAQELRLIKIGMASNVDVRIRDISLICPDEIEVIGLQVCHRDGRLEAELHERFAEHRVRGEWFLPHADLLDHIEIYGKDHKKALERLNAIATFPTLKRGRPTREIAAAKALALSGKSR